MRTTMQTIHQNILGNLNRLTESMNQINNRISSGKEMSRISDNPVNLVGALGLRSNLAEIRQYQTNLLYGNNFIRASENSLTQTKELLIRAKVLTLQAVNSSLTPENRANMAEEVRNLHEQAIILANTQENGKYIFAGHRTTGYNEVEPTPFMADRLDGYRIHGEAPTMIGGQLTGTVDNTTIVAGDLEVNGIATTSDLDFGAVSSGLNMEKASNAKAVIEATDPTVTAKLTTLYSNGTPVIGDTVDGLDSLISFELNGSEIVLTIPDGTSAADTATALVNAINGASEATGVSAAVGDGTNGGVPNAVVFYNSSPGDDSAITVAGYDATASTADAGFGDFSQAADATHNTGRLSLSSATTFELSSPNHTDDTILAALGLDGGGLGFNDEAGDGLLVYGPRLGDAELRINGLTINAPTTDGLSDVFADGSAAAKAAAINAQAAETGVTAIVNPLYHQAVGGPVQAGVLSSGDLIINGVDIFGPGSGNLTTLRAGDPASGATVDSEITFRLNGSPVQVNYAGGTSAAEVAQAAVLAINELSGNTGVSAFVGNGSNGGEVNEVVFRNVQAGNNTNIQVDNFTVVTGNNDLGFADFNGGTPVGIIGAEDHDNALINAINSLEDQTGILATRSSKGSLMLSAADGRNLHLETSERGERLSRLNTSGAAVPQDRVYFGSVQLRSDREFSLETTPTAVGFEPGLEALGLAGGGFETEDVAGDGEIRVNTILQKEGSVRYTGERGNDIAIKVSKSNTLDISKNGEDALLETGVFAALKNLENYLRGQNFTTVTSLKTATDLTATFASGNTGIPEGDAITAGSLTVMVTDHDHDPPRDLPLTIPVDPAVDTPEGMAQKINGIPGLTASWDSNGALQISTRNAERYSFTLSNDSSGLLEKLAISTEIMQVQALDGSLTAIDQAMDALTGQVSDFGARSNRIEIQNQILVNLELSATENLSEKEDTDLVKALMELKNKEVAYQAALSAAAKTMQLSLVNYL